MAVAARLAAPMRALVFPGQFEPRFPFLDWRAVVHPGISGCLPAPLDFGRRLAKVLLEPDFLDGPVDIFGNDINWRRIGSVRAR